MNKANPILGICLMTAAMFFNSSKDSIAKLLSDTYSPISLTFVQLFATTIILLPFVVFRNGIDSIIPNPIIPQVLRSIFLTIGLGFFYWSVNFIHIADATAMVLISPLIVAALSPVILKEPIGPPRTIAVLIGFVGVLIILRPTMDADRLGYLIALGAGVFIAAYYIANRKLSSAAPIIASTFYSSLIGVIVLIPIVSLFWTNLNSEDFWFLSGFVLLATIGQIFMLGAFSLAAASVIAPFVYTQIAWATFLGYLIFNSFPDKWSWIGIVIVVTTGIYIALQEASVKKD